MTQVSHVKDTRFVGGVTAYYQTRAAHHVVTSDLLAQAQAAVGCHPDDVPSDGSSFKPTYSSKSFSVIDEFNNWQKLPDLAKAMAAIRAFSTTVSFFSFPLSPTGT
ncbi:hypothetical protein NMG60_11016998 [Bertholletia excelsa]